MTHQGWSWDPSLRRCRRVLTGGPGRVPAGARPTARRRAPPRRFRSGRLLDVGCGPGSLTLPLARWFAEAVGVDPDAHMLAEAARQADRAGITNVTWLQLRAEQLPAASRRRRS